MEYKVGKKSCNNFNFLEPHERLIELSKCFSYSVCYDAEWKEVPGFPNYFVSSSGQVKHTKSYGQKTRLLAPTLRYNAYFYVTLTSENGRRVGFPIDKLVAMAFIKVDIEKYVRIQHVDNIKYNNRLDNLKI